MVIKVGIDAGHGGRVNGATRPLFPWTEAIYNMALARQLQTKLRMSAELGGIPFEPILLRIKDDSTMSLAERGEISKAHGCNIVVHLHVNAHPSPDLRGGLVFCWPDNRLGIAIGDAIARALPAPLFRRRAHAIEATDLPMPDDDWLERPRDVMAPHDCTSVLVEVGYMSNDHDREALCLTSVKTGLVVAIESGLCEAWRRLELTNTREPPGNG
jgi:N-acetylmuramoyl-L-alanine amidase